MQKAGVQVARVKCGSLGGRASIGTTCNTRKKRRGEGTEGGKRTETEGGEERKTTKRQKNTSRLEMTGN
jgi:hypothetical protein